VSATRPLRDLAGRKKAKLYADVYWKTITSDHTPVRSATDPDGDFTEALTDNYQKLFLKGRHEANRWISADIEAVEDGAFVGSVKGSAQVAAS